VQAGCLCAAPNASVKLAIDLYFLRRSDASPILLCNRHRSIPDKALGTEDADSGSCGIDGTRGEDNLIMSQRPIPMINEI
jgi:hypothetical protein